MTTLSRTHLCILISGIIFFGCKKQNDLQSPQDASLSPDSDEVSLVSEGGKMKLTLRPGHDGGQDVYVEKIENSASTNKNFVPELCANSGFVDTNRYATGSYIRFNKIKKVDSTAEVLSAKLYLYGLASSESTPQGNTGDNGCYVKRVTSPWDEASLTSPLRPAYTNEGTATLPASTSQWGYNAEIDVTTIVAYFVAHPSENYGFNIGLITQSPERSIVFGSSEQSQKSLRPKLVIRYK